MHSTGYRFAVDLTYSPDEWWTERGLYTAVLRALPRLAGLGGTPEEAVSRLASELVAECESDGYPVAAFVSGDPDSVEARVMLAAQRGTLEAELLAGAGAAVLAADYEMPVPTAPGRADAG
jgi:hypothetical protein